MASSSMFLESGRKKSAIVKFLQQTSGKSNAELAAAIGVSPESFDVKITRDSFSWEQMLLIIQACGYKARITSLTDC